MPTKPEPAPTDVPRLPLWRRPRGVTAGTWHYVTERTIADHYDAFVADTPLCDTDTHLLAQLLPGTGRVSSAPLEPSTDQLEPSTDQLQQSTEQLERAREQPSNSAESEVVLDLGCGTGRAAIPLAERGYHVIAIDLSQRMLRVMMDKVTPMNLSGIVHPIRANLVELDCIAERTADHAVCLFSTLGMIQGRENRRTMLRHVGRIVAHNGTFMLHVHNRWAAVAERGGLRSLAVSRWKSLRKGDDDFGDSRYQYRGVEEMFMHRFSRRELIQDLRACGWEIDRLWRLAIDGSIATTAFGVAGGFIVTCRNVKSN